MLYMYAIEGVVVSEQGDEYVCEQLGVPKKSTKLALAVFFENNPRYSIDFYVVEETDGKTWADYVGSGDNDLRITVDFISQQSIH